MPLYDYRCGACKRKREVVLKLAELEEAEVSCLSCGALMARALSAPMVVGDYAPYQCPVTGRLIEGRRAHIENLKETGCRILEPGEKELVAKARRDSDSALDRAVDDSVEKAIHEMPTEKREKLIAEVSAGADAQITRTSGLEI